MEKIEKILATSYGGMLLMAILIFILGVIFMKIFLAVAKRLLLRSKLDKALHAFILMTLKIALWIIIVITILTALKVPTVPLVTLLGATGAAIALALRDSLANVAAGLIILFSKPILKGEVIEIAEKDVIGIVDKIDLMTTYLHSFDNKKITAPNSMIINSVVMNYSREEKRRVDCKASISYDADVKKAKELLRDVVNSCPKVLKSDEIIIGVDTLGEDAVIIDVKAWCKTDDYYDVKYFIEERIKKVFDEENIEIPYRKLDVNLNR